MFLSWWQSLVNRGKLRLQSSAARRLRRRHSESRRNLFEPLEPRVLLAANPYINLSNGDSYIAHASSTTASYLQVPVRIDNLQDQVGDRGLSLANVALSYATSEGLSSGAAVPGSGSLTITAASESGTTVTITTGTASASTWVGELVAISGVSNAGYNGIWTITGYNAANKTFTYTDTSGLGTTTVAGATANVGTCVEYGTTAEVETGAACTFVTGESVNVSGENVAGYNGVFTILSVSGSTFSYTAASGLKATYAAIGSTAQASIFDLSVAPTVAWGPLLPSGWSTSTGVDPALQPSGAISLLAKNPGTAADITVTDPTNGGATPNGDVLAYVTLKVEKGIAPGAVTGSIQVDSANITQLVEDTTTKSTGNTAYPTLDPPLNASVNIVASTTTPVTEMSVGGISNASGGTTYSVPVTLTPSVVGGPGISSAYAIILFDPT